MKERELHICNLVFFVKIEEVGLLVRLKLIFQRMKIVKDGTRNG